MVYLKPSFSFWLQYDGIYNLLFSSCACLKLMMPLLVFQSIQVILNEFQDNKHTASIITTTTSDDNNNNNNNQHIYTLKIQLVLFHESSMQNFTVTLPQLFA